MPSNSSSGLRGGAEQQGSGGEGGRPRRRRRRRRAGRPDGTGLEPQRPAAEAQAEPEAGTDAEAPTTSAEPQPDDRRGTSAGRAVVGSRGPLPQRPMQPQASTLAARRMAAAASVPGVTTGAFGELMPELQRAIAVQGYTQPTPIQEQAIPPLLKGRDLLGCAQTGTGKTAAFTLPILQYLHTEQRRLTVGRPRALVLTPTRELAAQIGESIEVYGRFLALRHTVIFGGVKQGPQERALRRGVDIVVATPGRLLDLMQQGLLMLDAVEVFVLDEADRMLDMGFLPDVRRVVTKLPAKRHSLFFSATLPHEIVELARTLVHDPVHITVTPEQPAVERINQKVMFVGRKDKDTLLCELLADPAVKRALVFTQMKFLANRVAEKLERAGIDAAAIHGNKSQNARTRALDGFKQGNTRVLVATDLAARGIDVEGITHVVNYNMPVEAETYVHRIGRTARAGADGDAISFCAAEERDYLRAIERLLRQPIPVNLDHPYHCEMSRNARGEAARPAPRAQRGGGRGRRR